MLLPRQKEEIYLLLSRIGAVRKDLSFPPVSRGWWVAGQLLFTRITVPILCCSVVLLQDRLRVRGCGSGGV